ncbi:LptF/LptG family permease [Celeribacter sp.]|uniref:LptF/LptG family permease n=1 Tax=Celeribacter sp. TaxID=1890673 RepID=UPI003A8C9FD3
MGRFDRYLLQQLLMLFGFFALVLILVFWVNSAVSLLDKLLGDGQSARAFFYLTLLSLPSVMAKVLAIAGFAATVFVTNRLSSESELVVVQASGYSPYRLSRAVFVFSLLVTLMIAILSHVLVPMSLRESALRRAELAQDLTAQLLTEGSFVHPGDGVTFYVREITAGGELLDVYLSRKDENGDRQSFNATRALLVREDDGPMLLMFNGMTQDYEATDRRLSVTRFDSFAYALGPLFDAGTVPRQTASVTDTLTLLRASPDELAALKAKPEKVWTLVHERNGEALLAVAAVMIGFAALVAGGFSRFGLWRQILFAVVLLIVVKMIDTSTARTIRNDASLWIAVYLPALAGLAISYALLWRAAHPRLKPIRQSYADKATPSQNGGTP